MTAACTVCDRPMRPKTVPKAKRPDTICEGSRGRCSTCSKTGACADCGGLTRRGVRCVPCSVAARTGKPPRTTKTVVAPRQPVDTAPRVFLAVWPVIDPTVPDVDLLAEARADIRAVALRHGCRLADIGQPTIRDGRTVPGSGGAARVVVCTATVRAREAA